MAIDPASIRLPIGSGEVVEEGCPVIIHEVCVHAVKSIHHWDYGFLELKNDVQAANIETQGENSSDAHQNFLSILSVLQTLPRLNYIPSTLHIAKPSALSIHLFVEFLGFVFLTDDVWVLTDDTQINPQAQLAFSMLNRVLKVIIDHTRYSWLIIFSIADAVTNELWCSYWGSRHWNPTSLQADHGKWISIEDQLLEKCLSRNHTSHTRLFAVCHKVFSNQKFLCVSYTYLHCHLIFP